MITVTLSSLEASIVREALALVQGFSADPEWCADARALIARFSEAKPAPEPILHFGPAPGEIHVEITPEFAYESDTCPFNEPEGLLLQPGTYLVSRIIKREPAAGCPDEVEIYPVFIVAAGPLDPHSEAAEPLADFITPDDCERGYAELPFYVDLPLPGEQGCNITETNHP